MRRRMTPGMSLKRGTIQWKRGLRPSGAGPDHSTDATDIVVDSGLVMFTKPEGVTSVVHQDIIFEITDGVKEQ